MRDHAAPRVVVDGVPIDAEELNDFVGGHHLTIRVGGLGEDRWRRRLDPCCRFEPCPTNATTPRRDAAAIIAMKSRFG